MDRLRGLRCRSAGRPYAGCDGERSSRSPARRGIGQWPSGAGGSPARSGAVQLLARLRLQPRLRRALRSRRLPPPARSARRGPGRGRAPPGQVCIARAERKAVGSRTVGQTAMCDRDVEVAHQLPDHHRLLRVLLAEVGHVGRHDVESFVTTVVDALEMPEPARRLVPLERLGHPADGDRVSNPRGRSPRPSARTARRRPRPPRAARRAARRADTPGGPRRSPNSAGFTKSDTTVHVVSARARASATGAHRASNPSSARGRSGGRRGARGRAARGPRRWCGRSSGA